MNILDILLMLVAVTLIAIVISILMIIVQMLNTRRKPAQVQSVLPEIQPEAVMVNSQEIRTTAAADTAEKSEAKSSAEYDQVQQLNAFKIKTRQADNPEPADKAEPADAANRQPPEFLAPSATAGSDHRFSCGKPLLSAIEKQFYQDLKISVNDSAEIFCKVRVSDVIYPRAGLGLEEMQLAIELLSAQQFDFVLCNSQDLTPLCAIELTGHQQAEGLLRFQKKMLRRYTESAQLPVLRVDVERGYTIREIKERINTLPSLRSNQ
jgi:hypothetical protein